MLPAMRPIRSLTAVAALACACAAASLVSGAPSATAGPSSTPTEGSCHQLTYQQAAAYSDPQAPVSCDGPHTTITVKVAIVRADTVRTDTADIARQIDARCWPAAAAAVGGWRNYMRSAYRWYLFVPTEAEWSAGARWVRCDLVLPGANKTIQQLPATSGLSDGLAARETECEQGKTTGYRHVPCTSPHQFRATATIAMTTWTGVSAGETFANRVCARKYPHLAHRSYFAGSRRLYNWGARYVVCLPHRTN